MNRRSLEELSRVCQKPDHRVVGNWMARRVSRPLALHVTWLIQPWGISAHAVTMVAWLAATAAAGCFAWGGMWGWLSGAALLQLWYLLDHVDGQLARLHRTASLDGVQLDYLMHHTVNLLTPIGVGYGLAIHEATPAWNLVGVAWGMGLLMIGLQHDTRYKAFMQRLKRVRGELRMIGGGGARPGPAPAMPAVGKSLLAWSVRKICEPHVQMNLLSLVALIQWAKGDDRAALGCLLAASMAPLAMVVALGTLYRSVGQEKAEREFAAWYQVPSGEQMSLQEGWWIVEPETDFFQPETTHAEKPGFNASNPLRPS